MNLTAFSDSQIFFIFLMFNVLLFQFLVFFVCNFLFNFMQQTNLVTHRLLSTQYYAFEYLSVSNHIITASVIIFMTESTIIKSGQKPDTPHNCLVVVQASHR